MVVAGRGGGGTACGRSPGTPLAPIYTARRWGVERGQLREFAFGNDPPRYDRNRDRHDHAICTRCGRLLDVSVRLPRKLLAQVRRRTGMEVASQHPPVLGVCPARRGWGCGRMF